MKRASLLLLGAMFVGCAAQARPPAGWQTGGVPLLVPRATWNAGWTSVEVVPDGRVIVNGVTWFAIDAAGRVVDADDEPVAMLRPDGRLLGAGDEDLGFVGPTAAAAPGAPHATVAIAPNGEVLRYDDEGRPTPVGAWSGCGVDEASLHTCMLVTHLVSARFPAQGPGMRPPMTPYGPFAPSVPGFSPVPGLGVGIGIGIAPP